MKLDRNINPNGRGKYALIKLRGMLTCDAEKLEAAAKPNADAETVEVPTEAIDFGNKTPGDQFFVIRYKDRFAYAALDEYASEVRKYASMLVVGAEQDLGPIEHTSRNAREILTKVEATLREAAELFEYAEEIEAEAAKCAELHNSKQTQTPT